MIESYPHYRLGIGPLITMLLSFLTWKKRSFRSDALGLMHGVEPSPTVVGDIPEPPAGGIVILTNHYHRPGFQAWWIALAISSVIQIDLHWVVTSAWVYTDHLRAMTITPVSRWLLRRIAYSYDFTAMPAMPPREEDTQRRAAAVRSLLRYVKQTAQPMLGFAPEGFDSVTGQLQKPPEGVGRLLAHFANAGLKWSPVGVYEEGGNLILNFGALTEPHIPQNNPNRLDREVADQAMMALAACLPARLRGPYILQ
ncbi:MAG: hypothetical protein PVG02_08490 [Anaerolineales bacterium]|jgi:hypothetical protein